MLKAPKGTYTITNTAALLKVTRTTVLGLIAEGVLPTRKLSYPRGSSHTFVSIEGIKTLLGVDTLKDLVIFTPADLAGTFGIQEQIIRKWSRQGDLKGRLCGRQWRFVGAQVEASLARVNPQVDRQDIHEFVAGIIRYYTSAQVAKAWGVSSKTIRKNHKNKLRTLQLPSGFGLRHRLPASNDEDVPTPDEWVTLIAAQVEV